ncbi:MAG: glycosyltransferase family 1 protein [Candidatus Uhrbacteria bacterium]
MIVGIDATSANKKERTGVEWYTYHLIQNLKEVIPGDHQVVLYSATPLQDDLKDLPGNWKSQVLKWPLKKGWNTFRLSWEMLRRSPDVLFVPGNKLPLIVSKKVITTVHDIGPDRIPDKYEPKIRRRIRQATKVAVKKSTKIITVSEFTKRELIEKYKVAEDRVTAIPIAVDLDRYKKLEASAIDPVLQKYRLGHSYFFHIGRLEAKKNISTLIRAFEIFKASRGLGDPFELVLAGSNGFGFSKIKQYIEASEYKQSIRLLGRIPEADVPALMNASTMYLFPSWYEGFGIPALETMACGTPLIASEAGAISEVAVDAAVYVSPKEPQSWAEAMKNIISNGTLRDELIAKGLDRAKQFSWKKTAEQTWEEIKKIKNQENKKIRIEQPDQDVNLLQS